MCLFFFSEWSPKVLFLAIADKNHMLNFGQTKKQMHKTQSKLADHMRASVNNRASIKHLSLNIIKESFRNNSQERSGFSSEESYNLLWDGAKFRWVVL